MQLKCNCSGSKIVTQSLTVDAGAQLRLAGNQQLPGVSDIHHFWSNFFFFSLRFLHVHGVLTVKSGGNLNITGDTHITGSGTLSLESGSYLEVLV